MHPRGLISCIIHGTRDMPTTVAHEKEHRPEAELFFLKIGC